jgi:hypothetical protein
MRWPTCLGTLSMLLIVACDGVGPASGRGPMTSPSPASAVAACPDWQDASYQQGSLERDVDGDGMPDTVRLSVDRSAPRGCKAFVVVRTRQGDLVAPIGDENIPFNLGLPSLNNLVEIDGRDGAEVVADITAGASTAFAGVFSAAGGELRRMRFASDSMPEGDLFPYGGSVGHLESSDCARKGMVVISAATPRGRRYQLERRFFSVQGARLILEEKDRLRIDIRDLEDFPEFAGPPFVSCD